MRAGVFVSAIGHVGAVMMTLLAWEARPVELPTVGTVVPVEIVDVAAESNVRALAIPEAEETEPAPVQEASAEEETAPEPAPAPRERQRQQQRNNDEFDLAAVAGLLDKQREPGRRRNEGAASDRNQQGAGLGTAEVAALEDRVRALTRAHLMRCWRMPIDLPEPDRLIVNVQFELDRNGRLSGQPRIIDPPTFDPAMRQAREAALRAIRQCDPYPFPDDPAVGEHYQTWNELEFTFRPRS